MCARSVNPAFVQQMTLCLILLSGQAWTLQAGLVLSGWEGLQLLPQSGGQGEHGLLHGNSWMMIFLFFYFSMFLSAFLWVLVASGAAADARGPSAGSGPLLRLGRGLRSRKSGFPLIPLHLGGAAQGAESHLHADRHQAGKGARLCTSLCQLWPSGDFFFSTCLGCKGVFLPSAGHVVVSPGGGSWQQWELQGGHRVRAADWPTP